MVGLTVGETSINPMFDFFGLSDCSIDDLMTDIAVESNKQKSIKFMKKLTLIN